MTRHFLRQDRDGSAPARRRGAAALAWVGLAAAAAGAAGCAPQFAIEAETVVAADHTVERRMIIQAASDGQGQAPRIAEHLTFAPAGRYREFAQKDTLTVLRGRFERFDQIPPDVRVKLPGFPRSTTNEFHRRAVDFRLFALVDYEERLVDLANRADGEAALREFLALAIPDAMAFLRARLGEAYDPAPLEAYLQREAPPVLYRLYAGLWEMRRARRSGISEVDEEVEANARLAAEARALGIEWTLADPADPRAARRRNLANLRAWGERKLAELVRPRVAGAPPPGEALFAGKGGRKVGMADAMALIRARHGSPEAYFARVGALLPRAFGAFLMPHAVPIPWYARYRFAMRWRLPGVVLQTNALRDLDGSLLWTFTGEDAALAGQSMWARTVVVDDAAVDALGIKGFPGRLGVIEFVAAQMTGPDGRPREAVVNALDASVQARGLAPLTALGVRAPEPGPGTDEHAARTLAALLSQFQAAAREAALRVAPSGPSATSEGSDGGGTANAAASAPPAVRPRFLTPDRPSDRPVDRPAWRPAAPASSDGPPVPPPPPAPQ